MVQEFTVIGEVRGQGRPRACRRGKHAGVNKAAIDRQYEDNIRAQIINQGPVMIQQGLPVAMKLVFHLVRPKAHYRTNGELKDWARNMWPTTKPDLDNAEKAIKDALNSIVWHDDCQVVDVQKKKIYGEQGKVEIVVRQL